MMIYLSVETSLAQQSLINIHFDNCQIEDSGPQNLPLRVEGNPLCVCGLESDALFLDGVNDELIVEQDLSNVFNNDFTISFYVKIDNATGSVDVLSFQKECKRDSSFTIKYIPSIKEIRLDIVKNLATSTQMQFTFDEENCWQHIVFVRDGFNYYTYLNGKLSFKESVPTDYVFSPDSRLMFGSSPCADINNERMAGVIESIDIWNKALNEIEIRTLDLFPDHIMNNDTTLLLGESLAIEIGPSCADNFYWLVTDDLDDAFSMEPVITPAESTVYYINFQNGFCTSYDSIRIFTLEPDEVACENLLLPNAFTPNGDNLNEKFGISNQFIVDELISFDIYNRQGTRVFHGKEKNSSWDGSYQGNYLNPGKFAWVIEYVCNGDEYQKQGIVNLIR
jgi:gliding motility-associated-like protein